MRIARMAVAVVLASFMLTGCGTEEGKNVIREENSAVESKRHGYCLTGLSLLTMKYTNRQPTSMRQALFPALKPTGRVWIFILLVRQRRLHQCM